MSYNNKLFNTSKSRSPQQPGSSIARANTLAARRPGRPAHSAPIADVETRTLLLAAARRLFLQRGYADVAVAEIAQAANVTKPTLYYHCGNKEGLYADVLCNVMEEVGGSIRAVTGADIPVRQRLEELAAGYYTHADTTMDPLLRDATELLTEHYTLRIRKTYEREMLAPITQLMREGMHRDEIAQASADFLVQAWLGLLDAFTAHGGHNARTLDEHRRVAIAVTTFFLDGAAPR